MSVKIVFLGPLRDLAGCEALTADAPLDWPGLLDLLDPQVAEQLGQDKVKLACAGCVLADKAALQAKDGDEIALLPPVSGG